MEMNDENFDLNEFKDFLNIFGDQVQSMVELDSKYNGEADDLIEAIKYLKSELKDVKDEKTFYKTKFEKLQPELMLVFKSAMLLSDEEGEEFDDEDSEFDDEEDLESDFETDEFEDEFDEMEHPELSEELEGQYQSFKSDFYESPEFKKLSEAEKKHSDRVLETFFYNMVDVQPDPSAWTEEEMDVVLLDIFPSEVVEEEEFFEAIGNVLEQFLNFMKKNKSIPQAKELATHFKEIKEEMTAAFFDSEQWEPTKGILMSALKAGVDIYDDKELDNYFNSSKAPKKKK